MLNGKVKFFDSASSKQFGFISFEGKDVFFHLASAGMMASLGGDTPTFIQCPQSRTPTKGDSILFEMEQGNRGWRATAWAFPESLQLALEQITLRSTFQLIERKGFIMHTRLHNDAKAKYYVLWEGKNIEELKAQFPKDKFPLLNNDQFARYFKIISPNNVIADYEGDPRG